MQSIFGPVSDFPAVAESALGTTVRTEFEIEETRSPKRLAPFALTLVAQASNLSDKGDGVHGRFVVLHDPDGVDEWRGCYRVVVFARSDAEFELLNDPLVHEVAWSWVRDALEPLHCTYLGGTVTVSSGTSFGTMASRRDDGIIEVRASWTPEAHPSEPSVEDSAGSPQKTLADVMPEHVRAWIDVLSHLAGLPPMPPGVASVAARRARST